MASHHTSYYSPTLIKIFIVYSSLAANQGHSNQQENKSVKNREAKGKENTNDSPDGGQRYYFKDGLFLFAG